MTLKGSGHWRWQRITSVFLIPLTFWFVISVVKLTSLGYSDTISWMSQPIHALLMVLFIVMVCWHLIMGLEVVIDDYIHDHQTSRRYHLIVKGAFSLLALVGVASIVLVNL